MFYHYRNIPTTNFFWGGKKEYTLKKNQFQISNNYTGLQKSSFFLEEGEYDIILSTEPLAEYENLDENHKFVGVPKLEGSEEDNTFLAEMEDNYQRFYLLRNEKMFISSPLLNHIEKFYIYLKKN